MTKTFFITISEWDKGFWSEHLPIFVEKSLRFKGVRIFKVRFVY